MGTNMDSLGRSFDLTNKIRTYAYLRNLTYQDNQPGCFHHMLPGDPRNIVSTGFNQKWITWGPPFQEPIIYPIFHNSNTLSYTDPH